MNSSLLVFLFALLLRSAGLNDLAGEYVLASDEAFHVFGEGDRLYVRFAGQEQVPLHAEAPGAFRFDAIEGRVSFVRGPSGRVDHLILHGNRERRAVRFDDPQTQARRKSDVRRHVLLAYVGNYRFSDGGGMQILAEDDRQLYARIGNGPWLAIHAESESRFFFGTMDADLILERPSRGGIQITLRQGDRTETGRWFRIREKPYIITP